MHTLDGRIFDGSLAKFYPGRVDGDVTILRRPEQQNVLEVFQSRFLAEFVQKGASDVGGIFHGELQ